MNLIEKYIKQSDTSKYYEKRVADLDQSRVEKLETLLGKMEKAGAKDPLGWAFSEITENIPQFGRFLMLKGLFDIIDDTEGNLEMADDIDEGYQEDIFDVSEKLKNTLGEDEFNQFLKSYTKGVMWQVAMLLDQQNCTNDNEPGWAVCETNDGKIGRVISGLHEDFNAFENES